MKLFLTLTTQGVRRCEGDEFLRPNSSDSAIAALSGSPFTYRQCFRGLVLKTGKYSMSMISIIWAMWCIFSERYLPSQPQCWRILSRDYDNQSEFPRTTSLWLPVFSARIQLRQRCAGHARS